MEKNIAKILRSYLLCSKLVKIAKLTDEQFKIVMKNPKMLYRLDVEGLLDKFYKAKPLLNEKEIYEQLKDTEQKTISVDEIDDPEVIDFIKTFGNDNLRDFMRDLKEYTNESSKEYKMLLYNYMVGPLKNLINDYLNSQIKTLDVHVRKSKYGEKTVDLTELKDFIKAYKERFIAKSEYDPNDIRKAVRYGKLHEAVYKSIYALTRSIYSCDKTIEGAKEAWETAADMRESNMFDILFIKEDEETKQDIPALKEERTEPIKRPEAPQTTKQVDRNIPTAKFTKLPSFSKKPTSEPISVTKLSPEATRPEITEKNILEPTKRVHIPQVQEPTKKLPRINTQEETNPAAKWDEDITK